MNPSVHTRFENEKSVYWGMRDELLKKHFGKWVAIVNGKVSAIGEKKMAVLKEAFTRTHSEVGYINRIGYEEITKRKSIRQIVSGRYDKEYDPPVQMAGQEFPITVDCRSDFNEDILGRDIINEFELTVSAKRDLVSFQFVADEI
jgi:hypothetical protein